MMTSKTPTAETATAASWAQLAPLFAGIGAGVAAVGLSGDLLGRAVRNHPALFPRLLIGAMLATMVGFIWQRHLSKVAAIVVVLLAGAAIEVAAQAVGERDRPSVDSSLSVKDGIAIVTVRSQATGLRSSEKLLIRVISVQSLTPAAPAAAQRLVDYNPCKALLGDTSLFETSKAAVAATIEVGPNIAGIAKGDTSIQLGRDARGVCIYGGLTERDQRNLNDDRQAWSYLVVPV